MKRVLLVDDDPLVLRIYGDSLKRHGFLLETAQDGLAAMKALRDNKPDVVVLDLMMPKFSGTEVLKFMRGQADLAAVPVIVLSNAFMDSLAREAASEGAQCGILKVRCTPSLLLKTIHKMLENPSAPVRQTQANRAAGRVEDSFSSLAESDLLSVPAEPAPVRKTSRPSGSPDHDDAPIRAKAREDLLARAIASCAGLRDLLKAFRGAQSDQQRVLHLEDLYRRVHFLTAEAGLAGCHRLALLASALEALMLQLMDKPTRITPSVYRTIEISLDLFDALFQRARKSDDEGMLTGNILVVDDDPLSTRLVISALRQVQFKATSVQDPVAAIKQCGEKRFDLLLLDIGLPGMSGFELCRKIRAIPGYEKAPVVYVSGHNDFDSYAKGLETGAEDLIAKPVLPMELAVKTTVHLLRSKLEPA